jgi:hypothetical protein
MSNENEVAPVPAPGDPAVLPSIPSPLEIATSTYALGLSQLMGDKAPPFKVLKQEALRQIALLEPRDPFEELLIGQMLMTHARVVILNRKAGVQSKLDWAELTYLAADRAANTFRRQMESLDKHRQPRRYRRTSITTIRTAHINAKQIVSHAKETDHPPQAAIAKADQKDQTLVEEHRPENTSR